MRVISGEAGGKKLKFPKLKAGKRIRPLSDQAKEALFNILSARTEGSDFLDLFAGTGQVGIEALSRGARIAFFVDSDRQCVSTVEENLKLAGTDGNAEVYCMDALDAIGFLSRKTAKFDLIFIGAPYTTGIIFKAMEILSKNDIVKDNGIVIAEHSKKQVLDKTYADMSQVRQAAYGDTVFSFYRRGS